MGSLLLASKLTIYLSGLIALAPGDKGQLQVLFLDGNTFWNQHSAWEDGKLYTVPIAEHAPYLVINADDINLEDDDNRGFEVLGGPGLSQIVRFPLSGQISLENVLTGELDVDKALSLAPLAALGGPSGVCKDHTVKWPKDPSDWPASAKLTITGINMLEPDGRHYPLKSTGSAACPAPGDVYEAIRLEVGVDDGQKPTFQWGKGKATLPGSGKPQAWFVSIWNLPEKASAAHQGMTLQHFAGYFSLLKKRKDCDCEVYLGLDPGARPVFCPPVRIQRPKEPK